MLGMAFIRFLGRRVVASVEVCGGVVQLSDLIKGILICVPGMGGGLAGLEQHEGG